MNAKRILIVDDDAAVREVVTEMFETEKYAVVACETAEAALQVLEKENLQVMFFDLKLPGMNGLELCRRVRARNPIAIVYAMTAYITLFELADCREAGFDDYFVKPVNSKVFIKAAADAFGKIERWRKK